jgi:hypothetical protein
MWVLISCCHIRTLLTYQLSQLSHGPTPNYNLDAAEGTYRPMCFNFKA